MKKLSFLFITILSVQLLFAYASPAQAVEEGYCYRGNGERIAEGKSTEEQCRDLGGYFVADYVLLAPLPCAEGTPGCVFEDGVWKLTDYSPGGRTPLGTYLNTMLRIFLGICAVLAMIMIVVGGLEYMTSELVSSKESGKHKITGALLGLVLAFGSYAILNTINPDLLNTDSANLTSETVEVNLEDLGGESADPFRAITPEQLRNIGIIDCVGAGGKDAVPRIGRQFIGKTRYSMETGRRNTINSSTVILDCSSFVAQVYACARLPSPGGTTAEIFSSGNTRRVTATTPLDVSRLNPGDLVGWKRGDNGSGRQVEGNGHVMIYLGEGRVLHASSTSGGVTISNLDQYRARITYVKWP